MPKKKRKLEEIAEIFKEVNKDKVGIGVWLVGTVVCHNLNLAGFLNWFGMATDRVPTGLPGPFAQRRRFPWEQKSTASLEDKICEWGIPALTSWILVYHPDAVARLIDAMIPL